MKKRNILIGVVSFLMLFVLTGCGNKNVITTNDFISETEKLGYTATNVIEQYASYSYVKEATVAQSSEGY